VTLGNTTTCDQTITHHFNNILNQPAAHRKFSILTTTPSHRWEFLRTSRCSGQALSAFCP